MIRIRSTVAAVAAGLLAASIFGAGAAHATQPARALPGSAAIPVGAVARPLPGDPSDVVVPQPPLVTAKPLPNGPVAPEAEAGPSAPPLRKPPKSTLVGYDVSWPQCGAALPDPAFAIVGVTGGLANNTNPCLAEQLAWAETSTGGTGQPRVALYVNTANPALEGSWWPTSNGYAGTTVASPYGTCTGEAGAACAYVYGWAKAHDAVHYRGVSDPEGYLWWLDVETENTWQDDREANRAAIEGMAAYFQGLGARVGLYSTGYQWWQIVGTVGPDSNLYELPSWLAGASTLAGARDSCSSSPLTAGGIVTMTQYVANDLDHNHSCI